MPAIQLALFVASSFVGVIVGAVLQYLLGRRAEQERHVQLRRAEAYVDLVKALASLVRPGSVPDEQRRQLDVFYVEARTRVAIYGSAHVVSALAEFLRLAELQSPEAAAQLAEIVKAMRIDGLGKGPALTDRDISQVLFTTSAAPATSGREPTVGR